MFTFMNRLKTCFYEHAISIVAQANSARNEAYRSTLIIQDFAARANAAEVLYKHGTYNAEDYLKLAATHFDTDRVVTLLQNYAEEEEKDSALEAAAPGKIVKYYKMENVINNNKYLKMIMYF